MHISIKTKYSPQKTKSRRKVPSTLIFCKTWNSKVGKETTATPD